MTDVRDTVHAYRLIVERGDVGRPYNVCYWQGCRCPGRARHAAVSRRVSVRVVQDPARYRPNDTPLVLGDPTRATTELGWSPRITFEQTAHDLLEYWRTQVRA